MKTARHLVLINKYSLFKNKSYLVKKKDRPSLGKGSRDRLDSKDRILLDWISKDNLIKDKSHLVKKRDRLDSESRILLGWISKDNLIKNKSHLVKKKDRPSRGKDNRDRLDSKNRILLDWISKDNLIKNKSHLIKKKDRPSPDKGSRDPLDSESRIFLGWISLNSQKVMLNQVRDEMGTAMIWGCLAMCLIWTMLPNISWKWRMMETPKAGMLRLSSMTIYQQVRVIPMMETLAIQNPHLTILDHPRT